MKVTGMLFNAPMVRALLAGTKTQTRRVMKPQPARIGTTTILEYRGGLYQPEKLPANSNLFNHCPYGQPGDQIWVRETLGHDADKGHYYAATGMHVGPLLDYELEPSPSVGIPARTIPSIHMPRWTSRILLEIVSVRVERLNDCSAADTRAEGVTPDQVRQISVFGANAVERAAIYRLAAIRPYERLWESINGAGSWAANPWVWVIEFKRASPQNHE
ncbi:hypothetical protein [Janthinobacterium psychrotolerans]|uniref:Phage-related protein n=1 Tax=Janthinobacterium psychrotolerans TaxID=1747903 RepID=A0A1A7C040_9BURK|nr:hypothetical protein [Janthinobacterium psychrotolerans]OBV37693.1 hypothetical protein ASR47_1003357 [Janthinobacterium psychrotolerans]